MEQAAPGIRAREFVTDRWLPMAAAVLLFLAGLADVIGAAWGYGLFLLATVTIGLGIVLLAIYFMTRAFDGSSLRQAFLTAFTVGGWTYVLSVSALSGHFVHETLQGRMELRWIVFGPVVLAAIVLLDWGLYRVLVRRNLPTIRRYGGVMGRENLEPAAMRATFAEEVLLHRSLFQVSPFRWVRHQLILWGFGLMFAVELMAVGVREAWPSFGFTDVWRIPDHPVRLAFDFAFDLTGLMILLGCILALVFRAMVNGKPEQKYTDTPTAVFLLAVVLTGFILEGLRIAAAPGFDHAASFVGVAFAAAVPAGLSLSESHAFMWYTHMLLSCAFIAYVPAKRLVHSCATPIGRMVNSQKTMLAMKKERSLRGLLERPAILTPTVPPGEGPRA